MYSIQFHVVTYIHMIYHINIYIHGILWHHIVKVSPPPQSYELTTRMDGPNRPIGCLKPWRNSHWDSVVIRATCHVWETDQSECLSSQVYDY